MEAAQLRSGELGVRSRRRLEASDDFEELMLLTDCDRQGRRAGWKRPRSDEALEHLRKLARACGDG